jgi:phosphoglycerate dehydrogenase-like enzyme
LVFSLEPRCHGLFGSESALISASRRGTIAGAAIDVFDQEPLPAQHPFRLLNNLPATPHIGYVAEDLYRTFYEDVVTNIAAWLDEKKSVSSPQLQ